VGPFGTDATWLETCAFLDPETLRCRVHGGEQYPATCADYPGHNLSLDRETECERVERVHGGSRLLDGAAPAELQGLLLGPHALGAKVFVHPEPDRLTGVVERAASGALTVADRAEFVGVAAASTPGTTAVDAQRYETARETALAADSWAGSIVERWTVDGGECGTPAETTAADAAAEEVARGAPETDAW
jgi:hypothetical protein